MKIADLSKLNQLKADLIKNEVTHYWLAMSDEFNWLSGSKLVENMFNCISAERIEIIDQLCELISYSLDEYYQLMDYIKSDTETISLYLSQSGLLVDGNAIGNIRDNLDDSLHSLADLSRLN